MKCGILIAALSDVKRNFGTPSKLINPCVKSRELNSVTQMLVARKSKTVMYLQPKTSNLIGKPPY